MPEAGAKNAKYCRVLHLTVSALMIIAISIPKCSFALDAGIRTPKRKADLMQEGPRSTDLDELLNRADRVMRLYALDKIDIGLGKKSDAGTSPILLRMADLEQFLQREPYKDLLVVSFEVPIIEAGQDCIQATQNELKGFLDGLGYKRIVIMGSSSTGRFVIDDKMHSKQVEAASTIDGRRGGARHLRCENNLDRIDIGLGPVRSLNSDHHIQSPIYLSRDEIADFLKHEKHKDLLVVELGKPMYGELERQFRKFTDQLGYKRVDVQHSFGMFQTQPIVLEDAN